MKNTLRTIFKALPNALHDNASTHPTEISLTLAFTNTLAAIVLFGVDHATSIWGVNIIAWIASINAFVSIIALSYFISRGYDEKNSQIHLRLRRAVLAVACLDVVILFGIVLWFIAYLRQ
jgi:hypothetical protein